MGKIQAIITGVGGYVPEDILDNEMLSQMVDTNDEWIVSRVGIRERRVLKGEGMGTSVMAAKAIEELLAKTGTKPEEIDLILCATTTPDYIFPNLASVLTQKTGLKNAFGFDISAACNGFIVGMETGSNFIKSGAYKKVIVLGAEKMTSIVNYNDRNTSPLFGDGAAAVLLEPTCEELGVMDSILRIDGVGIPHLLMTAGGSVNPPSKETVENNLHTVHQDGKVVFKYAVSMMADTAVELMERNHLTRDTVDWLVPHQANMRIISATGDRMGLPSSKVMVNIERFGNTSSATIPLCLWEWEKKLKKGDNLVLAAFGAGFNWGAMYVKWAY
jgi:3-oxoacyl-[acyl-carrier-protein] synthase-3